MEFSREELHSVPIWITLPGLDFKYWRARGLSKIGSVVGKPLMVDRNTEKKVGLNFARLLAEVKIGAQLPEEIYFRNEKGVVIDQKVVYNWKQRQRRQQRLIEQEEIRTIITLIQGLHITRHKGKNSEYM